MQCVICKNGETRPGKTTITLERGGMTLVIKDIPAQVCDNCGEAYLSEHITAQLLDLAESASQAGVQVEVRQYSAA
jgi:YgiT-type zinc finger domain-containing protein